MLANKPIHIFKNQSFMQFHQRKNRRPFAVCSILIFFIQSTLIAQTIQPAAYSMLQWRMIGPHRGGRTVGAAGVPQQPNVFYIGVNNGGVWKTTDFGRTWKPIFDKQPTGSIGDIAVAPSNPEVIYACSGEGLQRPDLSVGNGVYKSVDGGKTWTNTGLMDAQQIGGIAIDPHNENRVFIAALGHPYGPNVERGIYRTLDGGKTWEKVLYKDENTGAIQVTIDPVNPNIVFADLWAGRLGPWENGAWQGPESGLFKSVDGGSTWTKITKGLPAAADGLGRIGFCIAASNTKRMYACVDAAKGGGVYKSDDAGESWNQENIDQRLWDRGSDFAECKADPKNADIVYIANVVTWKSADAGKSWKAFRGAPGGDDYHRLWFNPEHPEIILLCSDQGAEISVNGGDTWSSWYNQPTAQFYHVSTDNAFPYNVYGGQQESGSVSIASRGNDGQITFREWHPVGVEEYGYIAADPLDPNIIYGGKITKYNKLTGQVQDISPQVTRRGSNYRFLRTAPVIFSPVDPKTLYFAGNVLFKTNSGGNAWDIISPDLTRPAWDIPASIGIYNNDNLKTMPRRGVIYTVAPSSKSINTIWAGTDDGLIQLTRDAGKTWKNITPAEVGSWNKISMIDAGHGDDLTAYAAVNKIRIDDLNPYIYKTHDGGKTWKKIVKGLPADPVNSVREDPFCRGLLFAGTETAVYVSFNDGEDWSPLRLNMPATSVRDLVIKENDLVIGTHGRSFWILDDIAPLRDLAKSDVQITTLHTIASAYRVRWNMNTDTPLPQEEPAGQNPPDGAIIDYYLDHDINAVLQMQILDSTGKTIRVFTSADKPYDLPPVNIPLYWIRPQQILPATQGAHRFIWDLHTQPLDLPPSYPIAAIYGQTAPNSTSPWVLPSKYTVRLTAEGKTYSQSLTVKMDPRVTVSSAALRKQSALSNKCYTALKSVLLMVRHLQTVQSQIQKVSPAATGSLADSLKSLDAAVTSLLGGGRQGTTETAMGLSNTLNGLMNLLQESDMPVTSQAEKAVAQAEKKYSQVNGWYKLLTVTRLKIINEQLLKLNIEQIL
jgi:photosystem II stability/assembly factor-like uncharacterized protein